jgi:hypothetical protein
MNQQHSRDPGVEALTAAVRRLEIAVVGLGVALVGALIWIVTGGAPPPDVLAVERLEIVEPDGALAFVLANSQRPVGATMDGEVLLQGQEEERRGVPSIVFFDGKGDEVGGLLTGVRSTDDGFSATRHLSLDGYGQDQTVVLAHYQDPGGSTAGLTVSDRPLDVSMLDALGELGLEPGPTREELQAAVQAIPERDRAGRLRELFGVQRAFLGSTRSRDASLVLRDGEGRPRILLEVPAEGDPSLTILDEAGDPVLRLPS